MKVYGNTDKGKVRSSNQDAFGFGSFDDGSVWAVVCDGMGGANGGNVASRMAVDNLSASLKAGYRLNMSESSYKNLLLASVNAANIRVHDKAKEDSALSGMGTTVVAVIVSKNTAYIAHAGDSRAYLFVGGDYLQLTRDHSVVQNMVEDGKISREEAHFHPRKNVITRALGVDESVEVEFTVADLAHGNSLLLCTDGLTNYIKAEQFKSVMMSEDRESITQKLIDVANSNGGGDNITAVVIDNI